MSWTFKENSLDAIRLFAASQVAVLHTWEFMYPAATENLFFQLIRLFPGVPIFFFISGYLISKSFQSAPTISDYAKNRILRLYPALIICVLGNIILVGFTGYFALVNAGVFDIALLFAAKSTVLQFYNPDFMRAFGDGVLNGSLWTICVELQFYFITPILYALFANRANKKFSVPLLLGLIILFVAANRLLYGLRAEYSEEVWWKLYRVSFAPWVYMFLVGVLVQQNFDYIKEFLQKVPLWAYLFFYVVCSYLSVEYLGAAVGNELNPVLFVVLVPLIVRAAYSAPSRVNKVLKGNDISYGIYIWHMPIVNQFLYYGYSDSAMATNLAVIISYVIAILSWMLVEKPALRLKKYTLNTRLSSD